MSYSAKRYNAKNIAKNIAKHEFEKPTTVSSYNWNTEKREFVEVLEVEYWDSWLELDEDGGWVQVWAEKPTYFSPQRFANLVKGNRRGQSVEGVLDARMWDNGVFYL